MEFLEKWKDKATNYVDIRLGLIKLNVVEKTSTVLGYLMLSFILLFMVLAVLIFLGIGMMEVFSSMLDDNRIGGAFLTFGFYVIIVVILALMRKKIVNGFAGMFISILTDPGSDDDHEEKHGKKVEVS